MLSQRVQWLLQSHLAVVEQLLNYEGARLATKSFSSQLTAVRAADWQQTKTTAEYSNTACPSARPSLPPGVRGLPDCQQQLDHFVLYAPLDHDSLRRRRRRRRCHAEVANSLLWPNLLTAPVV